MTEVRPAGRLCNQIIRDVAVSILARKFNLSTKYASTDVIDRLGIPLFTGGDNVYETTLDLSDSNYMKIYDNTAIDYNLNPNTDNSYFQTPAISKLVFDYLRCAQRNIIDQNPFKAMYSNNSTIFVHCRLTDVEQFSPGYDYYSGAIRRIQNLQRGTNVVIASDDPTHTMITRLTKEFGAKVLVDTPEKTIQFGSTCKYVILSHGSFSAMIGWLAFFAKTIYYPEYKNDMWHGDMFSQTPTFVCYV